jgi:hypothetical protein
VTLRAPDGAIATLHDTSIDLLDAGASRTVTLDWTAHEAGQYSLALSLDAGATVAESNEANNVVVRSVTVAAAALPTITVSTDAASYGAHATLKGKVTLSNAGPQVLASLTMRVEDMDGYLVEILSPASVVLNYGQTSDYALTWNTGAILAGSYRVAAQLRGSDDVVLASGVARFEIAAKRTVSASVLTSQPQYGPQQAAEIGGSVELAAGNASLPDASALIEVLNGLGEPVFETSQALGTLQPGAAVAIAAVWPTGANGVGAYRVTVRVAAGAETVASAQADVTLVADARARLSGAMSLSSATLANGDRLTASYTVRNNGSMELAALPLSVTIIDPDTQQVLAIVNANADLAPEGSLQGEAGFDAAKWPLKTLQVVFSAQIDGKTMVLQRSVVRVLDRGAPTVVSMLVAQDGVLFVGAASPVMVKASDRESLLARVEYAQGSSSWLPFMLENRSVGLYIVDVAGMQDGLRQYQARAIDAAGNVSEILSLNVMVDNTLPTIVVTGVQEGAVYTDPVSALAVVSDANLLSSALTLDGLPYVAGTPVTASGPHALQVEARDKAGNTAVSMLHFTLTPAPLQLSGSVSVAPKEVQAGAQVAVTQSLVNGGAALGEVALALTIVDAQSNALVFTRNENVVVAANGNWTADFGWTVDGSVGTSYIAKLTASVAGQTIVIGEDRFSVVAPIETVQISDAAVHPQRVLIFALCQRPAGGGSVPTWIKQCDSDKVAAIVQHLNLIGVSYKLVANTVDFAREMAGGGYSAYWLSSGGTKINEPLQTELDAALWLGEGLLVDGVHAFGPNDKALHDLLGVSVTGEYDFGGNGLELLGKLYPAGYFYNMTGAPLAVTPHVGSTVEAKFGLASIVSATRGSGHTLMFGFDWASTFRYTNSAWTNVSRASFAWLAPVIDTIAPMIAGDVVTRKIGLRNTGQAVSLKVVADLPPGAIALGVDAGATSVTWQLNLAAGEERDLAFQMTLPLSAGTHELRYSVSSVVNGVATPAGSETVVLPVTGLAALAGTAQEVVGNVPANLMTTPALLAEVQLRIGNALQYSNGGNKAMALNELVLALRSLTTVRQPDSDEQLNDAHKALARVIRAVERRP